MPIDEVVIQEREPPTDVVAKGKQMSNIPNAIEARIRPHPDGWEIVAKGGDRPDGPPFDVQAFVEQVKEVAGDGAANFTPRPADNEAQAIFTEGRYDG